MFYTVILLIFITGSCEFKYSPYDADTPTRHLNQVNRDIITQQETQASDEFRVAFISDTHNYYDDLNRLVSAINRNGPYSFVVLSGDLTNLGLLEEFEQTRKQLSELKYPYLVAIGNHDLLANGKQIFSRMFGSTDFTVTYKNAHFIFFNNNNWESSRPTPRIGWVEASLADSTAEHKILVAHVSPSDPERFSVETIATWAALMDAHQVRYFMHGHDHNSTEGGFGAATRITIGSPSKGHYYELQIGPGRIRHQKISF